MSGSSVLAVSSWTECSGERGFHHEVEMVAEYDQRWKMRSHDEHQYREQQRNGNGYHAVSGMEIGNGQYQKRMVNEQRLMQE